MGSSGGEQRASQVGLRGWWPLPNTGGWGSCPQVSARDSPAVRLCPDAVGAGLGSSCWWSSCPRRDRGPHPTAGPLRSHRGREGGPMSSGKLRDRSLRVGGLHSPRRGSQGAPCARGSSAGSWSPGSPELPGLRGLKAGNHHPPPVVGAGSQIQLLTQCIIITANSPLKRNHHQYDISRQQGK